MEGHQVRGESFAREPRCSEFDQPIALVMTHSVITSACETLLFVFARVSCARFLSSSSRLFFSQVRALYDFTGESGTAELSITAGELLTVIRDNVGDGWCEGFNQNGQSGLFPAAYVQMVEQAAPSSSMCGYFYLQEHMYTLNDIPHDHLRYLFLPYVNTIRSSN